MQRTLQYRESGHVHAECCQSLASSSAWPRHRHRCSQNLSHCSQDRWHCQTQCYFFEFESDSIKAFKVVSARRTVSASKLTNSSPESESAYSSRKPPPPASLSENFVNTSRNRRIQRNICIEACQILMADATEESRLTRRKGREQF